METSEFESTAITHRTWNSGRKVGAKRALKLRQVWAIRFFLDQHRRIRDRALFDLAIDSTLSGCAVVRRSGSAIWCSVVRSATAPSSSKQRRANPFSSSCCRTHAPAFSAWLERRGGTLADYVYPSRIDHAAHLSTRQYARLVDEWVVGVGLRREEYGTHSLRRTKASIIYKATGNLRAVQILLGHTKIENTVRYLGVDVEDALTLAEGTEI